jgi:ATP-dependent RNA helicase RhlE
LKDFRDGRIRTLVATDIAARGIDVEGISHVVNFDLPNIPESYVHRIGRTARAGADGIAISLCSHDELPFLRDIEKLIRMAIPATGQASAPRPGARPPQQHQDRNGRGHGRPGQQQRNAKTRDGGRNERGGQRNGQKRNHGRDDQHVQQPDRQSRHQVPHSNATQGPRPIASTQPVGADFAKVSFMQPR